MTSLAGRSRTALLVIDVQNGVVGEAYERDRVVANIAALVDRARVERVPVVWVAQSGGGLAEGSDAWQYVDEPHRDAAEPLVHKTYADAFEDTSLDEVLADLAVGRLVVAGAQTDVGASDPRCTGRADVAMTRSSCPTRTPPRT